MLKWFLIAVAAGFGGIAPNLFRLGTALQHGDELPESSFVLGMILFFIMGGALALAFQEDNGKKAFFLGLSLPAMFQSGISDVSEHTNRGAALLIPTAFAAESQQYEREPPVKLRLYYPADTPAFSIMFVGEEDSRREEQKAGAPGDQGYSEFQVPRFARAFHIQAGDARSARMDFDHYLWYGLDIKPTPWQGLKQSIGVRGAPAFVIELRPRETEK